MPIQHRKTHLSTNTDAICFFIDELVGVFALCSGWCVTTLSKAGYCWGHGEAQVGCCDILVLRISHLDGKALPNKSLNSDSFLALCWSNNFAVWHPWPHVHFEAPASALNSLLAMTQKLHKAKSAAGFLASCCSFFLLFILRSFSNVSFWSRSWAKSLLRSRLASPVLKWALQSWYLMLANLLALGWDVLVYYRFDRGLLGLTELPSFCCTYSASVPSSWFKALIVRSIARTHLK